MSSRTAAVKQSGNALKYAGLALLRKDKELVMAASQADKQAKAETKRSALIKGQVDKAALLNTKA